MKSEYAESGAGMADVAGVSPEPTVWEKGGPWALGYALADAVLTEWHSKDSNFYRKEPESVKLARAFKERATTR